jgi:hypothetical protein
MEIGGVNIMNQKLNKIIMSGLMVAAIFGLASNTAVNTSALDQVMIVHMAHAMNGIAVNENDGLNVLTSLAHVMSTSSKSQ